MLTKNIFVVEDNDSIALLMDTILSAAGYKVYIFETGDETLAKCRDMLPDLIFMDLNLPSMDGYTTCALLMGEYPQLKIVGFSADMSPTVKRKCLAAGMVDAFDKNLDPHQVEEITARYTAS